MSTSTLTTINQHGVKYFRVIQDESNGSIWTTVTAYDENRKEINSFTMFNQDQHPIDISEMSFDDADSIHEVIENV